mmetsp:Transcript_24850/g.68515  ORF Transcript_24850/g.68515 Transcript_24850/m.68515 type:complete len:654 (+) Transcript_24850:88-2049(+)
MDVWRQNSLSRMTGRSRFILPTVRTLFIVLSFGIALLSLKATSQTYLSIIDLVDEAKLQRPTRIHSERQISSTPSAAPGKESRVPETPSDFRDLDWSESSKRKTGTTGGKLSVATRPLPQKETVSYPTRVDETIPSNDLDGGEEKDYNVHVVVSHCNKPIGWIWEEYLDGLKNQTRYSIRSITVTSKCGVAIPLDGLPFHFSTDDTDQTSRLKPAKPMPLVTVVSLPNVGRCDHSFAFWITKVLAGDKINKNTGKSNTNSSITYHHRDYEVLYSNQYSGNDDVFDILSRDIDLSDLILFMKDNNNNYRSEIEHRVSVIDMFNDITNDKASELTQTSPAGKGMSCASFLVAKQQRWRRYTNWAHRSVLWTFRLKRYAREKYLNTTDHQGHLLHYNFRSEYRPMGEWIKHLSTGGTTAALSSSSSAEDASVFSDGYLNHAVRGVDQTDGFYYNFTHNTNTTGEFYNKLDLVPMCYGGVFSTQWGQLSSGDAPITKHGWNVVTSALSRGDNIEEGHYMERWWGDILSWSAYSSTESANDGSGGRRRHRPRASGEVLTAAEQTDFLKDKLRHWDSNSPYVGLVILRSEKERRRPTRAEIISNWETIRAVQKQRAAEKEFAMALNATSLRVVSSAPSSSASSSAVAGSVRSETKQSRN